MRINFFVFFDDTQKYQSLNYLSDKVIMKLLKVSNFLAVALPIFLGAGLAEAGGHGHQYSPSEPTVLNPCSVVGWGCGFIDRIIKIRS